MGFLDNLFPWLKADKGTKEEKVENQNTVIDPTVKLPSGRTSTPDVSVESSFNQLKSNTKFITPDYAITTIPTLRKLYKTNPDVGLAVHDMVTLTNTGFEIFFDQSVSATDQAKMRAHLHDKMRTWSQFTGGLNGFLNKLIAQVWLTGAISAEWVPQFDLRGIEDVTLVNTETIRFSITKERKKMHPYQKVGDILSKNHISPKAIYKKLNTNTYKYMAINGDAESPYAIPPFMTAIASLATQDSMLCNIKTIVDQVGLMGFLEVLIEKPNQQPQESTGAYEQRLNNLLVESRNNIKDGFKDGVMVGYLEDHEFEFHSTTKNISGLDGIFNLNEVQVANGLKQSPSFLGINGKGSETGISIVFTKMLSQLNNVQIVLSEFLEYGFALELSLAGFNFKNLEVKFNKSTVTDDLKLWQAKEIKQRVLRASYDDGIISQEQYADEMGYLKPDKKEPRIKRDASGNPSDDQKKKEEREKSKDDSDRRSRDKKKDQPKRKDRDTRKQ